MHKEPLLVQKARDLNLDGYLIKEDVFDSFHKIITAGKNTGFILSDKLNTAMFSSGKSESTGSLVSMYNNLTQREQTVFRFLAEGLNYKEIGGELGIKQKTVLVHRYNLLKKMKLSDQTELVKSGMKLGLVDSIV
ncbi:MAG: LuxR C-terminal-related transcriptional regulator [Spirochaetota bacterium]|nr:LuxR C-terminal-related transcriptional regulator [Spirochaetota bacterium]